MNDMEANHPRSVTFFEVARHSGSHVCPERLHGVAFGEYRLTDCPCGKASLGGFLYDKHDLNHGDTSTVCEPRRD